MSVVDKAAHGLALDSGEFIPAAAVNRAYHGLPIDADTPRGVKLQLISRPAGVATDGIYTADPHGTHWAPPPTFSKDKS